ncbi:MAG TPA: TlpA disulfide reductase family protein [Candidatus Binataceae bacterium]|nr:TlpA disulfide reductase family protein [Candidatus Binataceae bacterium]
MENRDRLLNVAAAIIVAAGLVMIIMTGRHSSGVQISEPGESEPAVSAGSVAADFKLEALDGHTVSLQSLRGKVVFLNVWASWCGPCREEMPSMQTLYETFKNNPNFVMLAVSQDTQGRKSVAPYIEKNGYGFTVLLDPENQVGESYDVSGVPETFIIDQQGKIAAHHMGPYDWSRADVKQALQELIDSKKG